MKSLHKLLLPISLLVLVLILAGCGQTGTPAPAPSAPEAAAPEEQPAEPAVISYWHTMSDPETAQLENVVAAV